ncbi:MAG: branched-chain amino acid ABC transporter substrate-binding protein [Gemmatimonadales bacterium]|nr:branched-chain amino acid ABC transporter substrate-binding protein [Gemmatimonadales bacterium]
MALFDPFRLIAPRVAALALGSLVLSCGGATPIRIGVAGSFSDPIGLPMKLAAELAADEINAAGGINGRRLELVPRDDYADPDSAVFIATDLYESGVSAVVGHLFSGMTLAASPVYNGGDDPVVAISPSSSSPEVTSAGDYTFRICPSDLAHGAVLAHWVRDKLKLQRGAVLYLNDQYGRGIRQTFVREFFRLGGQLASIDPYLGDKPDVAAYLDRIVRTKGIEFLVVAGNRGEAEEIIRQARRRGLTIPVLGGDGLEGIHEAGELAEGVYLSSAYFPTIPTESNRRFVQAFQRKYPTAGLPNQPAAATYDAVYLLRHVIASVGPERQDVRRALAGVGSATPAHEGVTGTVAFDAAGDVPDQNVYIGLVRQGEVDVADKATEVARGR